MFLDDELLKMCEDTIINTPDNVIELNNDICQKCENYYKSKLTENSTDKEVKCILDRTFNLFDSFVINAKKSQNHQIKTFGELFENHTFKKQFLANNKVKEIYDKL